MTKKKHNGPGKFYRKGMTLSQLADIFPNDQAAKEWFIKQRWPTGNLLPLLRFVEYQQGQSPHHAVPLP